MNNSEKGDNDMKSNILIISIVIICLAVIASLPDFVQAFGPNEENLLAYDIESSKIPANYENTMAVSDNIAGIIHYNAEKTDCSFALYINHPGFDFGYRFRFGGSIYDIVDSLVAFQNEYHDETIIMSLNKPQIVRIEINGAENKTIEIDENEPFVVIVPAGSTFSIFDISNNEVKYTESSF